MTNAGLNKAIAAFKRASDGVRRELAHAFPIGAVVEVRLLSKQTRWTRAKVLGYNLHHGGANVRVELINSKPFSRGRVRDVSYNDVIGKGATTT